MFRVGMLELVVIFAAIFLLFGPQALLQIARRLGEIYKQGRKMWADLERTALGDDAAGRLPPRVAERPSTPSDSPNAEKGET